MITEDYLSILRAHSWVRPGEGSPKGRISAQEAGNCDGVLKKKIGYWRRNSLVLYTIDGGVPGPSSCKSGRDVQGSFHDKDVAKGKKFRANDREDARRPPQRCAIVIDGKLLS